jgi:hypothetical protein
MRENLALSALLILSVFSLGLLFEAKKKAWIIEIARLLLLIIFNSYFIQSPGSFIIDLLLIISLVFVYKNR